MRAVTSKNKTLIRWKWRVKEQDVDDVGDVILFDV